jgi:hypothetical protein
MKSRSQSAQMDIMKYMGTRGVVKLALAPSAAFPYSSFFSITPSMYQATYPGCQSKV